MKKFMVIYMVPTIAMQQMMEDSTPEQQKEMMDTWNAWIETNNADMVDAGTALGKNKRVTKDEITDTRNEMTGYSIVQAESHEAAAKLVQDIPNFEMPEAYIEVMEMVEM